MSESVNSGPLLSFYCTVLQVTQKSKLYIDLFRLLRSMEVRLGKHHRARQRILSLDRACAAGPVITSE